jgi:hypothetical protein
MKRSDFDESLAKRKHKLKMLAAKIAVLAAIRDEKQQRFPRYNRKVAESFLSPVFASC